MPQRDAASPAAKGVLPPLATPSRPRLYMHSPPPVVREYSSTKRCYQGSSVRADGEGFRLPVPRLYPAMFSQVKGPGAGQPSRRSLAWSIVVGL